MLRRVIELLEARDCPAPVDAGGGVLALGSGVRLSVYGDTWSGRLNVADLGTEVDVGPGPGGGPRLARLDPATGARVVNDVFLGAEGDRSGLIPLAVSVPPPAPLSVGPADGYPLFLDGASAEVTRGVYDLFAPAGNVRVTNARPDLPPGDYATVLVGVPLPEIAGGVEGALGYADVGAVARPHGPFQSPTALVRPPDAAEVAAHEAGHLFGLFHVDDPLSVMSTRLVVGQRFSPDQVVTIHSSAAAALAL